MACASYRILSFLLLWTASQTLAEARVARMCRIQVEREGDSANQNQVIAARPRPSLYAHEQRIQSKGRAISSLVVSSGMQASLDVNGEMVSVRCTALRQGYDIEIFVGQDSKEQAKTFSTAISLQRGQRTEIGSIVRDLKNKGRTLSTEGVDFNNGAEQANDRVFLTIQ